MLKAESNLGLWETCATWDHDLVMTKLRQDPLLHVPPYKKKAVSLLLNTKTVTWEETNQVNKEQVKAEWDEDHNPNPT